MTRSYELPTGLWQRVLLVHPIESLHRYLHRQALRTLRAPQHAGVCAHRIAWAAHGAAVDRVSDRRGLLALTVREVADVDRVMERVRLFLRRRVLIENLLLLRALMLERPRWRWD